MDNYVGFIKLPLTGNQVWVLRGLSDITGIPVEVIATKQLEEYCNSRAAEVSAKDLLDAAESCLESIGDEDGSLGDLKILAGNLKAFIDNEFKFTPQQSIEPELNWLEDVIRKSKEYKHDDDGTENLGVG